MVRWLIATLLIAASVGVGALAGCKRTPQGPTTDAGKSPEVDCDQLLRTEEVEQVCGVTVVRRTRTMGEGALLGASCDRKWYVKDRGTFGLKVVPRATRADAMKTFRADVARVRAFDGYAPVKGVGDAAHRFVERIAFYRIPTLVLVRGAWVISLYVLQYRMDAGLAPVSCDFKGLAALGHKVGVRLTTRMRRRRALPVRAGKKKRRADAGPPRKVE